MIDFERKREFNVMIGSQREHCVSVHTLDINTLGHSGQGGLLALTGLVLGQVSQDQKQRNSERSRRDAYPVLSTQMATVPARDEWAS